MNVMTPFTGVILAIAILLPKLHNLRIDRTAALETDNRA